MRTHRRSPVFTESEEEIWKAWRSTMFFPRDRETATYLQLRDQTRETYHAGLWSGFSAVDVERLRHVPIACPSSLQDQR